MAYSFSDTIAAVATPSGEGGVAIVRLSGDMSQKILNSLVKRKSRKLQDDQWVSHHMYFGDLVDSQGNLLDTVLAVVMRSPHSYTGEDTAEIHCHGGRIIPQLILDLCIANGARLAGPGEYTYRAFMSGKMDLAQAESVLKIIEADSKSAVRLAAQGLSGSLSKVIYHMKDDILDITAQMEAELDYGDEIAGISLEKIGSFVNGTLIELNSILESSKEAQKLVEGIPTFLVGPPNAGKSTLWNALIGQDKALVTPVPGTTRDQLESLVYFCGLCLRLVDTAGIHQTTDYVESLGIERTKESIKNAGLIILLLDASCEEPAGFFDMLLPLLKSSKAPVIVVLNKNDLPEKHILAEDVLSKLDLENVSVLETSLKKSGKITKDVEIVKSQIQKVLKSDLSDNKLNLSLNQRQRESLLHLKQSLESLQHSISLGMPSDCLLLDFHKAISALNEITGNDVSEDILDRVFSKFCLGK